MRIGIIGAGKIGGTLARLFSDRGHEVALANSRGPETLRDLVSRLDGAVEAVSAEQAALGKDVVVVTIPFGRYRELPVARLDGTIVVDTTNYYPQRDGNFSELDSAATTSSELLAQHLRGARVVKAFNTIYFANLRERGRPDAPAEQQLAIPLAGDDEEAKRIVAQLIAAIGFAPVDTGTLADGRRQQPGTPVYTKTVGPGEARELLALAQ